MNLSANVLSPNLPRNRRTYLDPRRLAATNLRVIAPAERSVIHILYLRGTVDNKQLYVIIMRDINSTFKGDCLGPKQVQLINMHS